MKNRAFTLIELLVVVLIIGTLAAIALPQYQKTVDKAHMAQLVILANAANVAEEEYYLANGSYTNQWGDLSIDIPATTVSGNSLSSSGKYTLSLSLKTTTGPDCVTATDSRIPGVRLLFAHKSTTYGAWVGGKRACYADPTKPRALQLCQTATGKANKDGIGGGDYIYWFN